MLFEELDFHKAIFNNTAMFHNHGSDKHRFKTENLDIIYSLDYTLIFLKLFVILHELNNQDLSI